jgi:hypothetical protein
MDSNPESGRVLLTWTNFTPFAVGFQEMSSTFSDDIFTATPPTWHARAIISAVEEDGQASFPRFGRGQKDAFVAWARNSEEGFGIVAFASSNDGGATWGAPIEISGDFFPNDQVLGNDRIHSFPQVGVDRRRNGRNAGNIYVAWAGNDNQDGADIYVVRSSDGGKTFSTPLVLNSRPGNDSAQWFPVVAVDDENGRVFVFYYDQQIARTGDLTEATVTWSDDGGRSWTPPQPLKSSTARPWHAGWGNDTSQPNLGDYNMAVVKKHTLFTSFASTFQQLFTDGQPEQFFDVPITDHRRLTSGEQRAAATVSLGDVTATDSGGNGFLDPGETAQLTLPLTNYVTNPLNARSIPLLIATVSSPTPGVTVTVPATIYINIAPGATQNNLIKIRLRLAAGFVPGTDIELRLDAIDIGIFPFRTVTLLSTLHTGTPNPTAILAENFEAAAPGALPAGWVSAHGDGANVVPWVTSNTFCGTGSNGAFHVNANDGPAGGSPARWERLISPAFAVPADSQYVVLEFDVCYDTEDDPSFNIQAFDGLFLRITDLTPGHVPRSNLVEAFANEFTTGSFNHYPKHFPRNNELGYFPQGDMSAWSGDSTGVKHVRMRLPGMAGTVAQLRFEYTQDGSAICSDVRPGHSCGVLVDNVTVNSVVAQPHQ